MSEFTPGMKVSWKAGVSGYSREKRTRTGIFHHYIDHHDTWAEELARITNVDGTDTSINVAISRLERVE